MEPLDISGSRFCVPYAFPVTQPTVLQHDSCSHFCRTSPGYHLLQYEHFLHDGLLKV